MIADRLLPGARVLVVLAGALVLDAAFVYGVVHRPRLTLPVVALLLLFLAANLLATKSHVLAFVALALPMTQHTLNIAYPVRGGVALYPSDVVAALAVMAWVIRRSHRDERRSARDRPAVLGWPLLLFGAAVIVADIRGHAAWGASLIGQPLRYVLYAAIGLSLLDLDVRKAHRGIVAVFYTGTVWMMLNAVFYVATGRSQTDSAALSTGGSRYLSGTVAVYMGTALFLALLNFQLDTSARRRTLHLAIAVLALIGVILGYFRAVFVSVGVILPVLLLAKRVRRPLLGVLPLALPLLAILAIAVPRVTPNLVPELVDRVTRTSSHDPNVAWRLKADHETLKQFAASPLYGVGFGKSIFITLTIPTGTAGYTIDQRYELGQGAHNAYLWMLAAGGLSVLVPFLLLIAVFLWDSWQRLRFATAPHERVLVAWCIASVIGFLIPQLSSPPLDGSSIIGFWVLLLLPGIVPRRDRARST